MLKHIFRVDFELVLSWRLPKKVLGLEISRVGSKPCYERPVRFEIAETGVSG